MDRIVNIVRKIRESRILNERKDYSQYSIVELVTMAQEGDQLAVETIINDQQDMINMMANKYFLGKDYDIEDLRQIATIGVWEAIMSWNKKGEFDPYVGMVLKRKFMAEMSTVNAEKRQSDQGSTSLDDPLGSDDEGGEDTLGARLSNNVSAEEEFLGKEGAKEIIRFLEKSLSDSEREVIRKYIQGYKVSQIVEETGMKYKAVENAIMRVKNKLADYMRKSQTEAKEVVNEDMEFSDEEKQVLSSVLGKIEEKKVIKESAEVMRLKESYENYTEEQLSAELEKIEEEIEELINDLEHTPGNSDDRGEILDMIDIMRHKLFAIEDFLNEEQSAIVDELQDKLRSAKHIYPVDSDAKKTDPYAERGIRRTDFYTTR